MKDYKKIIAMEISKIIDIDENEIDKLKIAEILYDIGNLMIPQDLFLKSEPLTDDEKNKLKEHPLIAAREILKPISNVQEIIPIIENHHENWDGTGYPMHNSGSDIPLTSQIILLLDAYFAMIEPRSYRKALTKQEALNLILADADKKWSKELVEVFMKIMKDD